MNPSKHTILILACMLIAIALVSCVEVTQQIVENNTTKSISLAELLNMLSISTIAILFTPFILSLLQSNLIDFELATFKNYLIFTGICLAIGLSSKNVIQFAKSYVDNKLLQQQLKEEKFENENFKKLAVIYKEDKRILTSYVDIEAYLDTISHPVVINKTSLPQSIEPRRVVDIDKDLVMVTEP